MNKIRIFFILLIIKIVIWKIGKNEPNKKNNDPNWAFYNILNNRQKHSYFVPLNSKWPLLISINVMNIILTFICIIYGFFSYIFLILFIFSIINLLSSMTGWFIDLTEESAYHGKFQRLLKKNIKYGFILFLVSEGMFFLSFFWAFLHFCLSPSIHGGGIWPNEGIAFLISNIKFKIAPGNLYSLKKLNVDLLSMNAWYCFPKTKFKNSILFENPYVLYYSNLPTSMKYGLDDKNDFFESFIINPINFKKYLNYNYFFLNSMTYSNERELENYPVLTEELEILKKRASYHFCTMDAEFKESLKKEEDRDKVFLINMEIFRLYINDVRKNLVANMSLIYNVYDAGAIVNPYGVPMLNTALLLTSGGFITLSHKYLKKNNYYISFIFLILTILLSFIFMFCQFYEYKNASVSINDGAYGSIMFLATGFHGLHVIIGTIMLIVCLFKMYFHHFMPHNHIFFKCSIWYWHFVDGVWVLLYLIFYWWSTKFFFHTFNFLSINSQEAVVCMNNDFLRFIVAVLSTSYSTLDNLDWELYKVYNLKRDFYHYNFMNILFKNTLTEIFYKKLLSYRINNFSYRYA